MTDFLIFPILELLLTQFSAAGQSLIQLLLELFNHNLQGDSFLPLGPNQPKVVRLYGPD